MELRSVGITSNIMLGERHLVTGRRAIGGGKAYGASASVSGGAVVTADPPPGSVAAIRPRSCDAGNRSVAILQS
jgi:hypothetical protein